MALVGLVFYRAYKEEATMQRMAAASPPGVPGVGDDDNDEFDM